MLSLTENPQNTNFLDHSFSLSEEVSKLSKKKYSHQ